MRAPNTRHAPGIPRFSGSPGLGWACEFSHRQGSGGGNRLCPNVGNLMLLEATAMNESYEPRDFQVSAKETVGAWIIVAFAAIGLIAI